MIEFEDWAVKRLAKTDSVVLEATTNTWHLVDQLQPHAGAVTVVFDNLKLDHPAPR